MRINSLNANYANAKCMPLTTDFSLLPLSLPLIPWPNISQYAAVRCGGWYFARLINFSLIQGRMHLANTKDNDGNLFQMVINHVSLF